MDSAARSSILKTATLLNYINELVSQKTIKDPDQALGLYVAGRRDPEIPQLENAVVAEKKPLSLSPWKS